MERNIMFRCWDLKLQEWVSEDFHVFGEVTLFNLIGQHCYETRAFGTSLERYNDMEVTEYAGFADINNKPIYEKDIVQWITHEGGYTQYGIITWSGNGFWLTAPDGSKYLPNNLEVIGNTYENSDLVEKYNIV